MGEGGDRLKRGRYRDKRRERNGEKERDGDER